MKKKFLAEFLTYYIKYGKENNIYFKLSHKFEKNHNQTVCGKYVKYIKISPVLKVTIYMKIRGNLI